MAILQPGDRVRVKDRPDWPLPTGYKLAGHEGRVFDTLDEPEGYVFVLMDDEASGIDIRVPLGFRVDALEKI
jgi:hypothetical protein